MVWSILYNQQSEVFKGDISRGLSSAASQGGAHYLLEAEEIPNPSSYPMAGPWRWGPCPGGGWSKSWWGPGTILLFHFFSYSQQWASWMLELCRFLMEQNIVFRTSMFGSGQSKKIPERAHAFWCRHWNPHHFRVFFKWECHLDGDQLGQFL